MDVGHINAMAVDDPNFAMYDRNNIQHKTTLGAWKPRWAVPRKCCAGILTNARFLKQSFNPREQKVSHCRRLRNAIDAWMRVEDGDLQLRCWFGAVDDISRNTLGKFGHNFSFVAYSLSYSFLQLTWSTLLHMIWQYFITIRVAFWIGFLFYMEHYWMDFCYFKRSIIKWNFIAILVALLQVFLPFTYGTFKEILAPYQVRCVY